MKRSLLLSVFLTLGASTTFSQQQGPQGVLVNICLSVSQANGTYRFTNTCGYVIEVAAAQPYPDGRPNGSDTFQLFPNDHRNSGTIKLGMPKYWACAAPNGPEDSATHAAPRSNASSVFCPTRGTAGSAQ